MQPECQKQASFLPSTLAVALVWMLWHLPLWFIEGNPHQEMSVLEFVVVGICLSIWFAAIYNTTKCVFFCMLIHGLSNTLLGFFDLSLGPGYVFALIILTALALGIMYKAQKP